MIRSVEIGVKVVFNKKIKKHEIYVFDFAKHICAQFTFYPNLGYQAGFRSWVPKLGSQAGFPSWVPKLGSQAVFPSWVPKLGSEAGFRSWVPKLGSQARFLIKNVSLSV